jgi:hypothetical protein
VAPVSPPDPVGTDPGPAGPAWHLRGTSSSAEVTRIVADHAFRAWSGLRVALLTFPYARDDGEGEGSHDKQAAMAATQWAYAQAGMRHAPGKLPRGGA